MTPATVIGLGLALWLAANVLLLGRHARRLAALWREPVLRWPLLIIESDDWGPGPVEDAEALARVRAVLEGFRDDRGRHPVMTLGMVLAVPDGEKMRRRGNGSYVALTLEDARFAPVRNAIGEGVEAGVFAPQLHGMEHYWPPALLAAAERDPAVRVWLAAPGIPRTEDLPAHLQSRWADAATLPSRPLPEAEISAAIAEEVGLFTRLFGRPPEVAVPPTFLWNDAVERGWEAAGLTVLITPGIRFEARDGEGKLIASGPPIHNGQRAKGRMIYLVRDDYFEPALGHRGAAAIDAVIRKARLGRPALLETHRFNFNGEPGVGQRSLGELEHMLGEALARIPSLRFMSSGELAKHLRDGSPEWLEHDTTRRMRAWLARVREVPEFRRIAKLTGLALLLSVLALVLRPFHRAHV